jgi:transcriptional regulator with XRE-family HTH domain
MAKERKTPTKTLGDTVRRARRAAGLSLRACATAAAVDNTWLARVERGDYTSPDPRHLQQVARALDIDVTDLYVAAGYQNGKSLPTFAPYLRAKYELPADAVADLERHFALWRSYYDQSADGGLPARPNGIETGPTKRRRAA